MAFGEKEKRALIEQLQQLGQSFSRSDQYVRISVSDRGTVALPYGDAANEGKKGNNSKTNFAANSSKCVSRKVLLYSFLASLLLATGASFGIYEGCQDTELDKSGLLWPVTISTFGASVMGLLLAIYCIRRLCSSLSASSTETEYEKTDEERKTPADTAIDLLKKATKSCGDLEDLARLIALIQEISTKPDVYPVFKGKEADLQFALECLTTQQQEEQALIAMMSDHSRSPRAAVTLSGIAEIGKGAIPPSSPSTDSPCCYTAPAADSRKTATTCFCCCRSTLFNGNMSGNVKQNQGDLDLQEQRVVQPSPIH